MTDRWGITFPLEGVPLLEHREVLQEAERLGYTDAWTAEVDGISGQHHTLKGVASITPIPQPSGWGAVAPPHPGVIRPARPPLGFIRHGGQALRIRSLPSNDGAADHAYRQAGFSRRGRILRLGRRQRLVE